MSARHLRASPSPWRRRSPRAPSQRAASASRKYSGRKSCPHWDTQCASSTTNRPISRVRGCAPGSRARRTAPARRRAAARWPETARSTAAAVGRARPAGALTSATRPGRDPLQRLHLVLHQRDQRRDDQRQVRPHQRRQLVTERLARAGGHHHQHVAAGAARPSTASRWPGRKASKPNSSCSAPSTSVGARPARGHAPSASEIQRGGGGGDLSSQASDTDSATIAGPAVPGAAQSRATGVSRARAATRARTRPWSDVPTSGYSPGEARVAVRLARAADRLVDALERQVGERVGAQLGGHLGLRAVVGDHLLARRHVDPVVAGMADRRRGDAHVHLAGARVAQHLHDLARRVAAHDRVVHDDDALARDDLGQRVELQPQAVLAQLLAGLDEGARDVAVLDQPVVLREPGRAREAARGRVAGVRHRDHQVGLDRRLAGEDLAHPAARDLDAPGRRGGSPGGRSRCARRRTARVRGDGDRLARLRCPCSVIETISPGWTSRRNLAPMMSNAQVSDATQ